MEKISESSESSFDFDLKNGVEQMNNEEITPASIQDKS